MHNSYPKVILISTDTHTLGIQTVGRILIDNLHLEPTMYYLPANVPRYPKSVEQKILAHIISDLGDNRAAIVAFSMKELNKRWALQLAEAIRKHKSQKKILLVAGGTYATACSNELLLYFDYVVVGSGEGMLEIVTGVTRNREDSLERIIFTPPSRFYPPLFSNSTYVLDDSGNLKQTRSRPLVHPQYKHAQCLEIMLSSGCQGSCSFCEVSMLRHLFPSYKLRLGSIPKIIDLVQKEVTLNPKIDYIYFFDEDFLIKPKKQIKEFCILYENKIRLPFFIFTTPKSVLRFPDKLRLLTTVGLDTVNIGIQTGSQRVAQRIFNRSENRKQALKAMELLTNLHEEKRILSPPMVDFIILNPYESVQDLKDTFSLIKALPVPFYAEMHCMSFFKGTELYCRALREGKLLLNYEPRYDLHDFVSRIETNQMRVDYRLKKNKRWLLWNILLYAMNGQHYLKDGKRIFGNLTVNEIEHISKSFESGEVSSLIQLVNLAHRFPNPMAGTLYSWELAEELELIGLGLSTNSVSSFRRASLASRHGYTYQRTDGTVRKRALSVVAST